MKVLSDGRIQFKFNGYGKEFDMDKVISVRVEEGLAEPFQWLLDNYPDCDFWIGNLYPHYKDEQTVDDLKKTEEMFPGGFEIFRFEDEKVAASFKMVWG